MGWASIWAACLFRACTTALACIRVTYSPIPAQQGLTKQTQFYGTTPLSSLKKKKKIKQNATASAKISNEKNENDFLALNLKMQVKTSVPSPNLWNLSSSSDRWYHRTGNFRTKSGVSTSGRFPVTWSNRSSAPAPAPLLSPACAHSPTTWSRFLIERLRKRDG